MIVEDAAGGICLDVDLIKRGVGECFCLELERDGFDRARVAGLFVTCS